MDILRIVVTSLCLMALVSILLYNKNGPYA